MSRSLSLKIWWPGMGFTCKKCGAYCDGKNSFVLADGISMVRWCDECNYLEEGRKDSHTDVSDSKSFPPENSDFLLLNPTLSRRRNMSH